MLSLTLGFFAGPILAQVFDFPMITIGSYEYYPSPWSIPLWWVASAVTALITVHLAGNQIVPNAVCIIRTRDLGESASFGMEISVGRNSPFQDGGGDGSEESF